VSRLWRTDHCQALTEIGLRMLHGQLQKLGAVPMALRQSMHAKCRPRDEGRQVKSWSPIHRAHRESFILILIRLRVQDDLEFRFCIYPHSSMLERQARLDILRVRQIDRNHSSWRRRRPNSFPLHKEGEFINVKEKSHSQHSQFSTLSITVSTTVLNILHILN
jgi:hypothetical protein